MAAKKRAAALLGTAAGSITPESLRARRLDAPVVRVRARYSIVKEQLAGVLYRYGLSSKAKLVIKPAARPLKDVSVLLQAARRIPNMGRPTI